MQSSAKSLVLMVRIDEDLNNTGPMKDPWGTTLTTSTFSDDRPSTSTCSVLELREDFIHWRVVPLIP